MHGWRSGCVERKCRHVRPMNAAETIHPKAHIAGLDGLRGLAVAAVVAFHLWPTSVPGGFLGVSVFFALSGYLITTLLLGQMAATGTVNLPDFYRRRARRLLPASLATLTVVAVGWGAAGALSGALRRDLLWSVSHLANWGRVAAGTAYGTDTAASPVLHFWSLAIEEQVYLVLPALVLVTRTTRTFTWVLAAGFAGAVYATFSAGGNASVVYYSTFTRVGEVLAGALVAVVVMQTKTSTSASAPVTRRTAFAVRGVALAGITAFAGAVVTVNLGDRWLYHGGLLGVGVVAAGAVAAISADRRVGRWLDVAPLAALGRISYGVYLFHWPLIVAARTAGWSTATTSAVVLGATVVAAAASYVWFETPLRTGALPRWRFVVMLSAVATVGVTATMVAPVAAGPVDFEQAVDDLAAELAREASSDVHASAARDAVTIDSTPTATPGPAPTTSVTSPDAALVREAATHAVPAGSAAAEPAVTSPETVQPAISKSAPIAFFGDSKALTLALGISRSATLDDVQIVDGYVALGCPAGRGGAKRDRPGGLVYQIDAHCDWTDTIPESLAAAPAQTAVVWFGTWDVTERRIDALGGWASLDDTSYKDWLLNEMVVLTDSLTASGVNNVVWLTAVPSGRAPESRYITYNSMLVDVVARRPGSTHVIDVAGWLETTGNLTTYLPDRVHFTFEADGPNSAAQFADDWFLAELEKVTGTRVR
jgi:peptidoglycan/LPS O-acetylase OafA/YrhL